MTTKLSNCYAPLPLATLPPPSHALSSSGSSTAASSKRHHRQRQKHSEEEEDRPAYKRYYQRDSGDGRGTSRGDLELRRLALDTSCYSGGGTATGSSSVRLGRTEVACRVWAPAPAGSDGCLPPSLQLDADEGTLYCDVGYAPHYYAFGSSSSSGGGAAAAAGSAERIAQQKAADPTTSQQQQQQSSAGRINAALSRKETELSQKLLSAIAPVVPLGRRYAKSAVAVRVVVFRDDGGALPAAVAAACLALADANVELLDLVSCCSVAVVRARGAPDDDEKEEETQEPAGRREEVAVLADPDFDEEIGPSTVAVATLAVVPSTKEVAVWEQRGTMSSRVANDALHLCQDGCRTVSKIVRAHLVAKHRQRQKEEEAATAE